MLVIGQATQYHAHLMLFGPDQNSFKMGHIGRTFGDSLSCLVWSCRADGFLRCEAPTSPALPQINYVLFVNITSL